MRIEEFVFQVKKYALKEVSDLLEMEKDLDKLSSRLVNCKNVDDIKKLKQTYQKLVLEEKMEKKNKIFY